MKPVYVQGQGAPTYDGGQQVVMQGPNGQYFTAPAQQGAPMMVAQQPQQPQQAGVIYQQQAAPRQEVIMVPVTSGCCCCETTEMKPVAAMPGQGAYGQQPMYAQQRMVQQPNPYYAGGQYAQPQPMMYGQQQPMYGRQQQRGGGMGGMVAAGAAGAVAGLVLADVMDGGQAFDAIGDGLGDIAGDIGDMF
jgi:hypothetical protein